MAVSSKFSIKCQTKSISLPCRSHPITLQIEEQLNKIKITTLATSKPSADAICSGLSQLTELYKCMNDLLNSSTTQVLINRQQNKKWVDELIEESVKFLDICVSSRDMVSQIKEQNRDLRCALRRRKGDSSTENSITKYNCFRKKMKKDVKGFIAGLKQVDNMTCGGSVVVDSDHHQLAAVMKAVIGVGETTISVFESLLMFFFVSGSKPNGWSLVVSKLMHKGIETCEDQQEQGILNELDGIDVALQSLCKHGSSSEWEKKTQIIKFRLERLEALLECMETSLESMFRRLIGTRASLLNIISH